MINELTRTVSSNSTTQRDVTWSRPSPFDKSFVPKPR